MVGAGDLDRRITIERSYGVAKEFNEVVDPDWQPLMTVWAGREDISDGEKFAAGGIGGYLAARFTVRHSTQTAAIQYSDRLLHDGREWNIVGLKEARNGRRQFIEITATVSVD
jgi:SPP1 family predicted phage head-tail adaptor